MRVGLLTTSFPRHERDPAGAFVLGFARALTRLGHSVEVLAPEPDVGARPPSWPGVEVRWVPYARPRSLERTFYGAGVPDNLRAGGAAWIGAVTFGPALALAARARAARWDAVVSHWAIPAGLAGAILPGDMPHLAVTHGADIFALERLPGGRAIASRVARGARALLFVSGDHRDRFLALLSPARRVETAPRCHVSPMGIEPPGRPSAKRDELRRALGLDAHTLLALGRLVPIKGFDDAIVAAAEMRKKNANVELVIAGEGPMRARLEELARAREARVRFVGVVSGAEKRDLFAATDAFLLPSRPLGSGREEGVPTALLEAMACGVPIVATRTGGVASIATHERSALIVPPGEPSAIAGAVSRLAADAKLRKRLGRSAARAARAHTWPEIAPRIASLLV